MTLYGGFAPSANVRPTTHVEVLLAIVAKIRANVTALSREPTCFISDSPWPGVEVESNLFCTVAPSEGQFDDGLMDGAGNLGVAEDSMVQVTVYSRIEVDQIERFEKGLTDASRGLLVIKQQILTALAGKNLDGGTFRGDSSNLLHEGLRPARASHKTRDPRHADDFASFSLAFRAKFSWDLGEVSSQF